MTIHISPVAVQPLDAVEAWFQDLGPRYIGRIAPDDMLLRGKPASVGWRLRTLGRELVTVVDQAFPFSRPSVYLCDVTDRLPHVEHAGKLCLRNPAVPSDPVTAVASALGEARQLLRDIAAGREEDDFQEDFGLYWAQDASASQRARVLLPGNRGTSHGAWFRAENAIYVFAAASEARRWWRHRHGTDLTKVRRTATIELMSLPHPENYPSTADELWSLVEQRSENGLAVLGEMLLQTPKSFPLVLTGAAPSGRRHAVVVFLTRRLDAKGRPLSRRELEQGCGRGQASAGELCGQYTLTRLRCDALDAANSRLPYVERKQLAEARVAIIGCGALGSGVARLLAKSGIGHLVLVDAETLGWENVRRHHLGANYVGCAKATGLAQAIAQENPDIGSTTPHNMSIQAILASNATALKDVDLVISCTADWAANAALDHHLSSQARGATVVYAWMEAHALASHAVLIMPGGSFRAGFDAAGHPRMAASETQKPAPAECGGSTSPFGAIELAHAETLTSRLALDFLRGKCVDTSWRTWLADATSLEDAEGSWTQDWIAARGKPASLGEMAVGPWWT
ncbi:ThiF family adenylyltransferase [Methylobacterium sp. Leaf123]|uniref:ThiF family adenylyltransferase n=1 Tax=Methylobacterium sp. Leaf123 TaxID=1736264 RepID=UPI0009E668F8|nr:ThiF family adenylyltransferase [Methylobacterium sp. Leaf123]